MIDVSRQKQLLAQLSDLTDVLCPMNARPFAVSFDLRLGVSKCFGVDANVFPSGWHRLPFPPSGSWGQNQRRIKDFFGWKSEEPIALIPEPHLHNDDYLKNLAWLQNFYTCAGFKTFTVPVTDSGSLKERRVVDHIRGPCHGNPLEYFPYELRDGKLWVEGVPVSFAISQYDGSKSSLMLRDPKTGRDVDLQLYPPTQFGWQVRRKHHFFEAYHRFVSDVEHHLQVDFREYRFQFFVFALPGGGSSVLDHWEEVEQWVDEVTAGSPHPWMLKSDHGTYGLGVEGVEPGAGIRQWSMRKIRQFRHGRYNVPIDGLVLQEGLPTALFIQDKVAERVDYYLLGTLYGSFFRMHDRKHAFENLNRPGAQFAQAEISEEAKVRLDMASALAFGGVCYEYREKMQRP
jgi:glutamate--cysteine ligase